MKPKGIGWSVVALCLALLSLWHAAVSSDSVTVLIVQENGEKCVEDYFELRNSASPASGNKGLIERADKQRRKYGVEIKNGRIG